MKPFHQLTNMMSFESDSQDNLLSRRQLEKAQMELLLLANSIFLVRRIDPLYRHRGLSFPYGIEHLGL